MPPNNPGANYQRPVSSSPRETEGRALLESARRLAQAQKSADKDQVLEISRLNWRLWTIFQAELTSPECQVPTEIRQNMLNLCNFVDKRTVAIIADPDPALLNVLISINRNVAAGLLTEPNLTEASPSGASTETAAGSEPQQATPATKRGGISA